jgi:hypothetical protein
MIARGSALLNYFAGDDKVNDDRVRVLARLGHWKLSIEEIALTLNCSEPMVRSLLARPLRPRYAWKRNFKVNTRRPIKRVILPCTRKSAISSRPASNEINDAVREELAQHLATEIHQWLDSLEGSDADRQRAIERAGILLDETPSYWDGEYEFSVKCVTLEIVGVCEPSDLNPNDQEFRLVVGRWLAAWIRFWIADPEIWNRALDLEFGRFGAKAQAV